MHVILLHDDIPPDAPPDQLDVFVQADALATALAELSHTSARLPFTLSLDAVAVSLRQLRPDVVINLVESVAGQGRLVCLAPALLDSIGVPYTGSGTEAMFITSSKVLTKRLLRAQNIPTAPWVTATGPSGVDLPLPARYVIKSIWEEASVGLEDDCVVAATDVADLQGEIRQRAGRLGGEAFAELYIAGREFNLSVLAGSDGPEVLPPAEIHFVDYPDDRPKLVGYRAKWDDESFEYHHTPRSFDFPPSDRALLDELCRLARECWLGLGLRGYARVDFRVDGAGRPWGLEINANPCLSPDAGFVAATQRAGLPFERVVQRILADAH